MKDLIKESLEFERLIPTSPSPGQILSIARERRGLSQADVAQQLRLSVDWIAHIEQDQYQDAPALAYIKGYLGSYARLVGVSTKEVLLAFDAIKSSHIFGGCQSEQMHAESFVRREPVFFYKQADGKRRWVKLGLVIAGLVIVVVVSLVMSLNGSTLGAIWSGS